MAEIKAPYFDVFDTVVHWRSILIGAVRGLEARKDIAGDWEGLVDSRAAG